MDGSGVVLSPFVNSNNGTITSITSVDGQYPSTVYMNSGDISDFQGRFFVPPGRYKVSVLVTNIGNSASNGGLAIDLNGTVTLPSTNPILLAGGISNSGIHPPGIVQVGSNGELIVNARNDVGPAGNLIHFFPGMVIETADSGKAVQTGGRTRLGGRVKISTP